MSLGGSSSSSRQSSQSSSQNMGVSASNTYLDPQQQANQQQLFNQYQSSAGGLGQTPGLEFNRQNTMNNLRTGASQLQNYGTQLRQGAAHGQSVMRQFANQNNPYLQSQIQGLAQDYGQTFREQILPGIGSNAQIAGQRGGSRQGIAEALGAQRTMQEFGQAATNLRAGAYGQQQSAANALMNQSTQANQAFAAGNQAVTNQGLLANQFANTGLAAQQLPFEIGATVAGTPSVLSQSASYDYGTSQSTSKGKGSSASMDVGFI